MILLDILGTGLGFQVFSKGGGMFFDKVSKLERLHKLKELGVLDEQEFEARKQHIVSAKPLNKWFLIAPLLLTMGGAGVYGGLMYKAKLDADKRKQQELALPIPMITYKKETKLIWESTSGYTYTNYGYYNNSAEVSQACTNANTYVAGEEANGWKIASSNPADKNVTGGTCKGRDIMLEREMPSITIG